jgi:transcription initiation factor TFIID TATA-box-binding protein
MEEKDIVKEVGGAWELTEPGKENSIEYYLNEIDSNISGEELTETYQLTIANIVGSLRLNRELDLEALSNDLAQSEYHPETYPSLIYRSKADNVSVLTPSSGRLAIVGAKSKDKLTTGIQDFLTSIADIGIDVDKCVDDVLVQNIVATFDTEREFDLSTLSIGLGLENIEYEPEQFPGIIYRTPRNSTILLFNSGKCVIPGAKTYLNLVEAQEELIKILSDLGIEIDILNSRAKNREYY